MRYNSTSINEISYSKARALAKLCVKYEALYRAALVAMRSALRECRKIGHNGGTVVNDYITGREFTDARFKGRSTCDCPVCERYTAALMMWVDSKEPFRTAHRKLSTSTVAWHGGYWSLYAQNTHQPRSTR